MDTARQSARIMPNLSSDLQRVNRANYAELQVVSGRAVERHQRNAPLRNIPEQRESNALSSNQSNNRLIQEELQAITQQPPGPKKGRVGLEPEPEDKKNQSSVSLNSFKILDPLRKKVVHEVSSRNPNFEQRAPNSSYAVDLSHVHELAHDSIRSPERTQVRISQDQTNPEEQKAGSGAIKRTLNLRQKTNIIDSMETESEFGNDEGRKFYAHGQEFIFAEFSLFLFPNDSKFRIALVRLITWKYFEYFITAMIIANSVLLGMMDYTDTENKSWRNRMVQQSEKVFTVIFTLEAFCKIIGMGFIMSKGCYLRNAWNWLDFIVVITSLLETLPGMSNISGLRTFRLFRPLRNLTTVPSMRTLVGTLLQSMAQLGGILSLAIFFFMIFAILGVNLWAGKIHQRCWSLTENSETGVWENKWDLLDNTRGLCNTDSQCGENQVCASYRLYLYENDLPTGDYDATNTESLNWGITNFDNIFSAFLTIFQCITMEGWTPIMYIYMDVYQSTVVILYYVSCIVTCSLFLLNLTVAVMLSQYDELRQNEGTKDFGELQEHANKASIPPRLTKFILENDMVLQKPKESEGDKSYWAALKRLKKSLNSSTPVPQEKYYQAPIVKLCFRITVHPVFQTVIMLIIVMNTVVLAMDKYPAHPKETQMVLDDINLVFTVVFTVEVVVKGVGLGLKAFCKEGFNIFDLVIVIISLLEISLSDGGGSFSALRAFRLFRIFKLFRMGDLRVLIDSIAFTVTTIGNYTVLLILFIYVYSLLGMQFFAGQLKFDSEGLPDSSGESPRANFDTLGSAAMTIFQILIGDNWNTVMYDCIRTSGPASVIFFITLIMFGNIVMLNLFLAILLGNFDRARLYHMKQKIIETFEQNKKKGMSWERSLRSVFPDLPQHMMDFLLQQKRKTHISGGQSAISPALSSRGKKSMLGTTTNSQKPQKQTKSLLAPPGKYSSGLSGRISNTLKSVESNQLSDDENSQQFDSNHVCGNCREYFWRRSLFIFDRDSVIRQKLLLLVSRNDEDEEQEMHMVLQTQKSDARSLNEKIETPAGYWRGRKLSKLFDNFVLALILLSSLSLAMQNPLDDPTSTYSKVLFYVDVVFTILFFLECMIKIISLGFLFCSLEEEARTAYLRSAWNILDFVVVVASTSNFVLDMAGYSSGNSLQSLKALRVLRALRPLRVIGRNEGLRLVVNALLSSIPAMTNVLMVCLLFLMIFAIMGINFFKGAFYVCELGEDVDSSLIKTKTDCLEAGGSWENSRSNFDDIFSAMLSLFEMMTTEGWLTVMFSGVDSNGVDKQPVKNNHTYAAIFFIGYMIIGSQFILNLFVGIVIDNFNKIKEKELGNIFLTEGQKEWMELQKLVLACKLLKKPVPPVNKTRLWFYKAVTSKYFEVFITSCIFGNTIVMAIKYYLMPEKLDYVLEVFNYIFAFIFNLECGMKIIGMGKKYFQDTWNIFDFVVVIGTNVGIIVTLSLSGVNVSSAASIVRAFRIMRLFVLIRSAKAIRVIIDTVAKLLPQITNIGSLVLLLFFIYAALGINLFSGVKYQTEVNSKNNFRTLGNAFLLLMRCATGEDWNLIMTEMALKSDGTGNCIPNQDYASQQVEGIKGCGTKFAYFYFLSFIILINMLIMNLTIAAVIEGLNTVNNQNSGLVTKEDITRLMELWMYYDPKGKGFVDQDDLVFFFLELSKPFQIEMPGKSQVYSKSWARKQARNFREDQLLIKKERGIQISRLDALMMLKQVEVPVYENNKVHFKDVFKKLVKSIIKRSIDKKREFKLSESIKKGVQYNEEEEDLDDFKLGFKIKQRMKKEWTKKYKNLKKVNKNKELSVTKIHAMQIIQRFFNLRKARKAKKSQLNTAAEHDMTALPTKAQNQQTEFQKEDEAASANLNDSYLQDEGKETNRKLRTEERPQHKYKVSKDLDTFALEMEEALVEHQKQWSRESREEEKVQVIPELDSRAGQQNMWRTTQNFGNFKKTNKGISMNLRNLDNKHTKEKSTRVVPDPSPEAFQRTQSPDKNGDLVDDSFFEKQNHDNLVKELENMREEDLAMEIMKTEERQPTQELDDSLEVRNRDEAFNIQEGGLRFEPISLNIKGVKTDMTNQNLVISHERKSL